MVSKNNKYEKRLRSTDHQIPHYGLRKLSVGVVTVLLGTSAYFGLNPTIASASDNVSSGDGSNGNAQVNQGGGQLNGSSVALQSSPATATATQAPASTNTNLGGGINSSIICFNH